MAVDIDDALPWVPTPSWLTRSFWESAREGALVRQVCTRCQANIFPPQFACPSCLSTALVWEPSSGQGRVYSFTEAHLDPLGRALDEPVVVADIDLEEGWHMMSNIVEIAPHRVRIAMPVEVTWRPLTAEINLPVFRPAGEPSAKERP